MHRETYERKKENSTSKCLGRAVKELTIIEERERAFRRGFMRAFQNISFWTVTECRIFSQMVVVLFKLKFICAR